MLLLCRSDGKKVFIIIKVQDESVHLVKQGSLEWLHVKVHHHIPSLAVSNLKFPLRDIVSDDVVLNLKMAGLSTTLLFSILGEVHGNLIVLEHNIVFNVIYLCFQKEMSP